MTPRDYNVSMSKQINIRGRLLLNIFSISICLWGPFSWLLFIDYPWNDYHWHWVKRWILLPGLLVAVLTGRLGHGGWDVGIWMLSGFTTAALFISLYMLARQSLSRLILACLIALVISGITAWIAYHGYVA